MTTLPLFQTGLAAAQGNDVLGRMAALQASQPVPEPVVVQPVRQADQVLFNPNPEIRAVPQVKQSPIPDKVEFIRSRLGPEADAPKIKASTLARVEAEYKALVRGVEAENEFKLTQRGQDISLRGQDIRSAEILERAVDAENQFKLTHRGQDISLRGQDISLRGQDIRSAEILERAAVRRSQVSFTRDGRIKGVVGQNMAKNLEQLVVMTMQSDPDWSTNPVVTKWLQAKGVMDIPKGSPQTFDQIEEQIKTEAGEELLSGQAGSKFLAYQRLKSPQSFIDTGVGKRKSDMRLEPLIKDALGAAADNFSDSQTSILSDPLEPKVYLGIIRYVKQFGAVTEVEGMPERMQKFFKSLPGPTDQMINEAVETGVITGDDADEIYLAMFDQETIDKKMREARDIVIKRREAQRDADLQGLDPEAIRKVNPFFLEFVGEE